jgi:ubiquinone/menaquinone biosynthesis C-methylase UbiE
MAMNASDLDNWMEAATIYAEVKSGNIYSCFCRKFVDALLKDASGLSVLDAGCGDGEYTEMFRKKGASAIGCDCSDEVIKIAKQQYPFCHFDMASLFDSLPYEDNQFDLVFSNLVLMDIDPIDKTVNEFYRVLRKNGKLFFSIVHPAFYLADWGKNEDGVITYKRLNTYLTTCSVEQEWGTQPVLHYHRPISFYLNLLAENRFVFSRMYEPRVYEESKIPDIPLFMFIEWIKR